MSPQSRATISDNTTFASRDDGWSGNPCSGTSSVAAIACAANMEYALHKIESESSATPANPLLNQASDENIPLSRKRSSARISSSPQSQPFLSSYGSAFLSGIFADIAQASDDQPQLGSAVAQDCAVHANCSEPCPKKARTTASISSGRQLKSHKALAGLAEGAVSEVSSPSVVSPRINTSTQNLQVFNDQVRELQDMAFPSLPQIPITVSSSSCSSVSKQAVSLCPVAMGVTNQNEHDSPSFGWFVSTDDDEDETADRIDPFAAPMFLPDTKPDLAFKAFTAPSAGNHDIVVQQALAADTIDDVLGDLF